MVTGNRRSQQLERTRADILDAVRAVLSERGYAGTRVEEICRRAGISRGAFYHHFPSKESALAAVLVEGSVELTELLTAAREEAGADVARFGALALATVLGFSARRAAISRAYYIDMQGVAEVEELRRRGELGFEVFLLVHLQDGIESGQLRSLDPAATVRACVGMAKETSIAYLQGRVDDLARALRELVRFALVGMGISEDRALELADEAAERLDAEGTGPGRGPEPG